MEPAFKQTFSQKGNRLISGYFIAFFLLLISYLLTLYSNNQLIKQAKIVSHTYKVIGDLENILSVIKDGETGFRGYVNTKDTVFLSPFYTSLNNRISMITLLRQQITDNSFQKQQVTMLEKEIEKKYDIMKQSLQYFIKNKYSMDSTLLKSAYEGKQIMDEIRNIVSNMQAHEYELLTKRTREVDSRHTAVNTIVIISLILAFIFSAFGVITFLKEHKGRYVADTRVMDYQKELKERIEELNEANRELIEMRREDKFASTGRLARMIAHEVRNPLTNIDLALSQLKEEIPLPNEDTVLLFDMINRNSNRINQLITDLLNATRFTDLRYTKLSVNNLLDEALELAKDRIELGKIKVIKDYTADICDVEGDAEKIKIALLNLIINAAEAMSNNAESVLTLGTRANNNKCVISISDNGSGMDDMALAKLFEPYFTTKPKGNGLGLTNTQNIILNHKGSIDAESTLGKGTTFIIEFNFAS